jgi:hypothetical protein
MRAFPGDSPGRILRTLVVWLAFVLVRALPIVFAQNDVTQTVATLIYQIIGACYAIMIPLILVGVMMGYVQLAGPWSLQTVKKSGRGQLEIGFITLFLFFITPALIGLITWIGTSLGGSWEPWLHPQT